jgi:hypothetical protein
MGLTPDANANFLEELYTVWSFIHLISRVFMVSLAAARINEHIKVTKRLFHVCPSEAYVLEV